MILRGTRAKNAMGQGVAGTEHAYPVVVLLKDGTRKKGIAGPFDPRGASFLVREIAVGGGMVGIHDIAVADIEAVFFVHDLALLRTGRETIGRSQSSRPAGVRLRVRFRHGETIEGTSPGYDPHSAGFLLYPDGPRNRSDNIASMYVVRIPALRVDILEEGPTGAGSVSAPVDTGLDAASAPVNLNSATPEQLRTQMGLRRNVAEALIAARGERSFQTWEHVSEVRGIGPVTLEKLKAIASI